MGGNAGTVSDLTGWDCPSVPAEMFLGQVPICLRHLEGLLLQVGWPIISSGHKPTSISANVKGMLTESGAYRHVCEKQEGAVEKESARQEETLGMVAVILTYAFLDISISVFRKKIRRLLRL